MNFRRKKQYRKNNLNKKIHPKIYVWSHTEKAEIEYFRDFRDYFTTYLLVPRREKCWSPQELLAKVIKWKKENINSKDKDQVWCIFDVDDFYTKNKDALLKAIKEAQEEEIKIAFTNQCFETWILLHFYYLSTPTSRDVTKKIREAFKRNGLGNFVKNQRVFNLLIPFQEKAIKNAKRILPKYEKIDWKAQLSERGNPSTSIHFLVNEINKLLDKDND